MGFRRQKGFVSRKIVAATFIAVVLVALACSRADRQPMMAVGQLKPDLVGHVVVITFVWKNPTSVIKAINLRGSVVGIDRDFVYLRLSDEDLARNRKEYVEALLKSGKIVRDDRPPGRLLVRRAEIEEIIRTHE